MRLFTVLVLLASLVLPLAAEGGKEAPGAKPAAADIMRRPRAVGWEPLLRWTPGWTEMQPGVAESWTASPDARQYTFKLREGMKWSDGKPYTADHIMFVYEDIMLNDKLTPTKP